MATAIANPVGVFARESVAELRKNLRLPQFALPTIITPAVFYGLFAIALNKGGPQMAAYSLATFGVFAATGPALFGFGAGVAVERESGLIELKRVSPMPTLAYFLAKIMMSLAFALAVIVLLSIAAIGVGGVRLPVGSWLLLVGALLLGTLPFCAFGLWIGTLVKGQAAVAVVNLIYLPMSIFSGLWIPLFAFPAVLQKTAVLWPAWHLGQLALGIVGQVPDVRYGMHVAALLAMTTLFLSLAALRLRNV